MLFLAAMSCRDPVALDPGDRTDPTTTPSPTSGHDTPSPTTTGGGTTTAGYVWDLPDGFPLPVVPDDNPMSDAKVELGRHLFYDRRLSGNRTQSCADCHHQELAFTDGLVVPVGSTGEDGVRNAPSIANAGWFSTLTWVNPILVTFEQQIPVPLFGQEPVELGLGDDALDRWAELSTDPVYEPLFAAAWGDLPTEERVSNETVVKSLATFIRSVVSGDSPYDRTVAGDPTAMSDSAKRGLALFGGERLECTHCHGTFLFDNAVAWEGLAYPQHLFTNDGLYDVGDGAYPPANPGLVAFTSDPSDSGKFRPPSLRNVALTAPYFHDGSAATLDDVLDSYERGGRLTEDGPWAGDGATNPYKNGLLKGFQLTDQERADVLAFLDALTDESLLTDPRYADPWPDELP
ncbi:MAG: MbnH family di-heme enzyme [Myxococcota bacterium]